MPKIHLEWNIVVEVVTADWLIAAKGLGISSGDLTCSEAHRTGVNCWSSFKWRVQNFLTQLGSKNERQSFNPRRSQKPSSAVAVSSSVSPADVCLEGKRNYIGPSLKGNLMAMNPICSLTWIVGLQKENDRVVDWFRRLAGTNWIFQRALQVNEF